MAEQPSGGGEKTEAPTAKRLTDSAKKGDVLQSKELGAALVVMAGAAVFYLFGSNLVYALGDVVASGLVIDASDIAEFNPAEKTMRLLTRAAVPFLGLFAVTVLAAIAGPVLLGSLGFRWSAMKPKSDKLNPLSGLKRMFGPRGLIELLKSLAKILVLGTIGLTLVYWNLDKMFALGQQSSHVAISNFGSLFTTSLLAMAVGLFLIAGIDVPSQIMQRAKRLNMTKQEVKDEHKEVEGSPEAKAALRQRQYETLSRSARKAMEEATVILNNPTHFSVALRYRPGVDHVPVVLARGRGAIALSMRELAEERLVPMLQYPQLTRAIYYSSPVGGTIDERLYVAVATVLAFLFRLDAQMADKMDRPHIDLPTDLQFDAEGKLSD